MDSRRFRLVFEQTDVIPRDARFRGHFFLRQIRSLTSLPQFFAEHKDKLTVDAGPVCQLKLESAHGTFKRWDMRYMVVGARKDNGENITLYVEASTQERAEVKALQRGVLIAAIRPLTGVTVVPSMDDAPATVKVRMAANSPVATKGAALPEKRESSPDPMSVDPAEIIGPVTSSRSRTSQRLALAAAAVIVPIIVLVSYFFLAFKPQYEETRGRLHDAVVQDAKTEVMQKKSDAIQLRDASIKTRIAETQSGTARAFTRYMEQLEFTEALRPFIAELGGIRDQANAHSLSAGDFKSQLDKLDRAYADTTTLKLDTSDREFFDGKVKAAIASYRDAAEALGKLEQHPELESEYKASANSAIKRAAESVSPAILTYMDMVETLEKL